MVMVGGRPMLWHIMKNYSHFGVRDFVVCLGYQGDVIRDYFMNYEARMNDFTVHLGSKHSIEYHDAHDESDWSVTLAETGASTLTGGRIFRAQQVDGSSSPAGPVSSARGSCRFCITQTNACNSAFGQHC